MSATLERWLAYERRHWSALVQVDDGTPDAFEDLARRSEAAAVVSGRPWLPRWEADSAFNPASSPGYYGLPDDLAAEWTDYAGRWERFLAANPRCRLASMLGEISEAHDASSFPTGWEEPIRAWVRSGFAGERPFHDGWSLDTPAWRAELARTAAEAGDGWVYDDDGRLVWR